MGIANLFNSRKKILIAVTLFIIFWIGIVKIFTFILLSKVNDDWEQIKLEKIVSEKNVVLNSFKSFQNEISGISDKITGNNDIRKYLNKNDTKKLFDEIQKSYITSDIQVEVYDKWLNLLAFKGRQLEPEYFLLQKAALGNKFSIIKDVGFYTFLIVFSPVKDYEDEKITAGVILTAKLIGTNYNINNKNSTSVGFISELSKSIKSVVEIIPADPVSGFIQVDSTKLKENVVFELTSIDDKTIGKIFLPEYDKVTHINNVENYSLKITAFLIFIFSIISFILILNTVKEFKLIILRIFIVLLYLLFIRYLWIYFEFPYILFQSEVFSPNYFASVFGFGIFKSLGELIVSSIFLLIFSVFSGKELFESFKKGNIRANNFFVSSLFVIVLAPLFFILSNYYASTIQSIIFDSNIKFLYKEDIIPGTGLFFVQLVILIVTICYLMLSSSILLLVFSFFRNLFDLKYFKKFYIFILFLLFIGINHFVDYFFNNLEIVYFQRLLIITLLFAFAYFVNKYVLLKKSYSFITIKNFSLILLISIIITPLILLEKTKSQETKFVELLGNEISEQEDDKITFLISNEITNLINNKNLENSLLKKNKIQKLAYYLWKESKLNTENYNSGIIILDTAKKLISDFNINSSIVNTDSIISFTKRKYFDANIVMNFPDSETDTTDFETDSYDNKDIFEPVKFGNINIISNSEGKYFVGIAPIEDSFFKNTEYARNLGYILIVINSGSNYLMQNTSFQIFGNFATNNLTDKLISKPVITEFQGGEVVSSNDAEVSKNLIKSLEPLREYLKSKPEATRYWRYENINNEPYRTLYVISNPESLSLNEESISNKEKIYAISIKRDDFSVTMFYYLKFILFTVFIYLIFYLIISIPLLFKFHKINFNFSEKLFVSFLLVSIIPIVFLAIYTRSYITNKNNNTIRNQIVSDLSLVNESLKDDKISVSKYKSFDSLKRVSKDILDKNFSKTDKNFNFFVRNKLVATTNDELFKSDLIDTRVDFEAFYNIIYLKKDFYIKNEDIGGFSFIVGYKPYKDKSNNVAGIISSISVYKQKEINEELTETLTFIFGSYFIVIIILLIIVSFITQRISKPILELKIATDKISRGEENVEINLKRNDELGILVESFNKMTRELVKSKNELKKAEREAAWRDIARRVAHEIKNPLTPMKLSIQHLFSVYHNNMNDDFGDVLTKTKNMIIREIDKLNRIATEFSNFAKLPRRNYEKVNINHILEEVISLYSLDPKVNFHIELMKDQTEINGDRQELNRAFQNIIKNAVQSITDKGDIIVKSYSDDIYVFVEVTDNGCGIEPEILDKLCEPNFSTKSQGMGLGLAITKKTLDDMKASIIFESTLNAGTTVRIKFLKEGND